MGDIEMDFCDFCHEKKSVFRTYLYPSKYTKSSDPNVYLPLYNEGNYFIIVKTCFDCGQPVNTIASMQLDKNKGNIAKAVKILIKNGVDSILLGYFGTYYQYEMAGTPIRFRLFDFDNPIDGINQDDVDELDHLLRFLEEDNNSYIYDQLGFNREGQYELYLNSNGTFTYKNFKI
jgi:hypothetical protein